ncbi:MAG TPA: hypothetical protein VGS57_19905 [Thermoanaerobaculia bacterium]|jgi:hypothetical protein|nr:hypothetical protein [Thermoanaerobaculia bacterium]
MSDKKNWGSTVLGWFVVRPEDEAAAAGDPVAADAAVAAAAEYGADQSVVAAAQVPQMSDPPPAPGGQVDFPAVYSSGGVEPEQQERVEKAASLLRSLPAETDPAVKKQIVEASLKAFGVPIDKIIEAGVEEIQALEAYIRAGAGDTQKLISESQARIAQFEEEVQRIKRVMDERVQEQAAVVRACNDKKLDVQRVLEFFGQEAVARVVRDSPKLIDPSQPQNTP